MQWHNNMFVMCGCGVMCFSVPSVYSAVSMDTSCVRTWEYQHMELMHH